LKSRDQSLDGLSAKLATALLVLAVLFNVSTAIVGCFVVELNKGGGGDFPVFYRIGRMMDQGAIRNVFEKAAQDRFDNRPTPSMHGYFYHPPYEALLLWPFGLLPYKAACLLWLCIQSALLFLSTRIVLAEFPAIEERLHPVLLMLAFFPSAMVIYWGQDSGFVFLLFALAFRDFSRGKEVNSGAYLALTLFKFQHVLPMLAILAIRKKWRVLLGFAGCAFVLLCVSLLMVGINGATAYLRILFDHGVEETGYMTNIHAIIASVGGSAVVTALASLAIVIACGKMSARPREQFAIAIVGSQLVNYHGGIYDVVLLLIPLFAVIELRKPATLFSHWPMLFFFSPLYVPIFAFKLWPILALPILLLLYELRSPTSAAESSLDRSIPDSSRLVSH
jgi:hypothetical protein